MAGIYVHIPFCRKACHYCNFHFSTSFKIKDQVLAALVREVGMRSGYLEGVKVETIYLGGGTPSVLTEKELNLILSEIYRHHVVADEVEITLEANPDDIDAQMLVAWRTAGINRLSIGVQGFQEDMLIKWNRSHQAAQGMASLLLAKEKGFDNISADLIYGDPILIDASWIDNVETLIRLDIPHISSYALTVETNTALHHQIEKGKVQPMDDEQSLRQYRLLQELLLANGYDQYEISNFSKPGYVSRHNASYWSGAPYLGIGPSAHSYNRLSRQWNVSNNPKYVHAIESNLIPCEIESLTPEKRYNELVMTGLRTADGIDTIRIHALGETFVSFLHIQIKKYMDEGKIKLLENRYYVLSRDQYFFADGIAADLFWG